MIKDDIKAALEGITPGPWFKFSEDDQVTGSVGSNPFGNDIAMLWGHGAKADAKLIAAAPELLTRALAEIERLEAQLAEANSNHEEFERKWYLSQDECEQAQTQLADAMADAARLKRLREMESQVSVSENRVCYYLRNINELDRLIKLDGLAKEST